MNTEDERITAWDRIARHPFFNAAFDDAPFYEGDKPLIDLMLELLDHAVKPPITGGKLEMTGINFVSNPDADGDYLIARGIESRVLFESRQYGGSAYLTLKDVAALHKALGDHLEANKRELPREGAVRFSGGQIAVYANSVAGWFITGNSDAWRNPDEIEKVYGTDWEELVVKDA